MMFFSLLVFLSLVIAGHYFAWRLCLKACQRWRSRRFYLLGIFIFFSLSFLTSFILLHASNSQLLAYLYVGSAVFFGFLSQLMIFGAFFWLLEQLIKLHSGLRARLGAKRQVLIARIGVLVAFCLFLLGTYNAFYPQVKTIFLSGWPEEYRGISFVQLSDLHLGAVYRPAWLQRVVYKTNSLQADFVVISGDLFDGSDEELSEFIPALSNLATPTIFVPGNHDYYILAGEGERVAAAAGLITLSDQATVLNNLELIGFNYLSRKDSNIRREIKNLSVDQNFPRIVINHVPVDRAEAISLGAKLMLSGHAHRGQIFPFSMFVNILYGRFAYGLEKEGGLITYTSAGTGTWGPPLRTLFPGEIIRFVIR